MKCDFCGIKGHEKKDCFKLKAQQEAQKTSGAAEGSSSADSLKKRKLSSLEVGELAEVMKQAMTQAISSISSEAVSSSSRTQLGTLTISSVGNEW